MYKFEVFLSFLKGDKIRDELHYMDSFHMEDVYCMKR